ncbi:hypothetical protein AVEN_227749-1 [Araneus ventricosus]|uniref:Uncharacterized protein n=1 Tax=Araneus ventricosus TaxID=182803 RepID=A0A4Y2LSM8_ARAVE|nr:hypothetical protein AVEN_227749-1 [Araneus ventricosus]
MSPCSSRCHSYTNADFNFCERRRKLPSQECQEFGAYSLGLEIWLASASSKYPHFPEIHQPDKPQISPSIKMDSRPIAPLNRQLLGSKISSLSLTEPLLMTVYTCSMMSTLTSMHYHNGLFLGC